MPAEQDGHSPSVIPVSPGATHQNARAARRNLGMEHRTGWTIRLTVEVGKHPLQGQRIGGRIDR